MKHKKPSNVVQLPKTVTYDAWAFICYTCDQYFFVDAHGLTSIKQVICPNFRCTEKRKSIPERPEFLGNARMAIRMDGEKPTLEE